MVDINSRIKEKTPFLNVLLQECEKMNTLVGEIRKNLKDLELGLGGQLNMTDSMEALSLALELNRVPSAWGPISYFSKKSLGMWFADFLER